MVTQAKALCLFNLVPFHLLILSLASSLLSPGTLNRKSEAEKRKVI